MVRPCIWGMALVVGGTGLGVRPAVAQQITVQQPVVSTFSVNTTVSVPDRGSVLLGGVSRAGDFHSSHGPLGLAGRSRSSFREHSNVSAHVWIHDFEAMDRYLLNQPSEFSPSAAPTLNGRADAAYRALLSRRTSGAGQRQTPDVPPPAGTAARPTPVSAGGPLSDKSAGGRADLYLQLAEQATARGKPGVAKIHLRLAARHGSKVAEHRLAKLERADDAIAAFDSSP